MKILTEIQNRSKYLYWAGCFHLFLALFLLALLFYDSRVLDGVSIYLKPIKFCISIWIFMWTMAWFLYELPQKRKVRKITWGIIVMLLIEIGIILFQAVRGQHSHFNIATLFDGVLFQIMGVAILINTLLVFWAYRLFGAVDHLPEGYKAGIRVGMVIFIIASLEGYLMAANLKHTVGAPDGQEGILFLNWAKAYGDLRVFHFLGLHALQVVPLIAWIFAKHDSKNVYIFGFVYFMFSLGFFWSALAGRPFWPF